jgi:hypothetical protein
LRRDWVSCFVFLPLEFEVFNRLEADHGSWRQVLVVPWVNIRWALFVSFIHPRAGEGIGGEEGLPYGSSGMIDCFELNGLGGSRIKSVRREASVKGCLFASCVKREKKSPDHACHSVRMSSLPDYRVQCSRVVRR